MKIVIGGYSHDVIKYKVHLRENEWANCIPSSIKIKMNEIECVDLKWFVGQFNGDFNFDLIREDGVYSCNSTLDDIHITSKFPNGDVICILRLTIWEEEKLNKSNSRNIILDDILN